MKTASGAAILLAAFAARAASSQCLALPGDANWPDAAAWARLNRTVDGRLSATLPIGHVCHDPTYDAVACVALQQAWAKPGTHLNSSSSVMQSFFANQSCDPFTAQSTPCQLGNYVSYAVNASCAADVQAAVNFTRTNKIRLVVRNTGHDYFGRSTGAGALAIWTHNMNGIDFIPWSDSYFRGTAMKIGAGVMGYQAAQAADAAGVVAVTGECPTVGLAGFTMGAGHSALSTSFGMGADQVLQYEVVTANGHLVTASPTENSDLFWALSGGGPGTYGVVVSMTVKTHPGAKIGGASLQLSAAYTTQDKFNQAFAALHAMLPNMTDLGADIIYTATSGLLQLSPVTVYNSTGEYINQTVLAPFIAKLNELGIPFAAKYTTLSYLDHYNTYMGPLPDGNFAVEAYQFGSRLIPRSILVNNNDALQAVLQNLTSHGVILAASAADYSAPAGAAANAVLPQWRDATMQLQLITRWDSNPGAWNTMLADQERMTREFVPQVEAVTPGSGTYVNEANFNQPDWKEAFFGVNYDKLLRIKKKWDSSALFYILKGVGSDAWTVGKDGRMCRAGAGSAEVVVAL
ncbi:FAD binding domain-containing protein [Parachaetomium inaequale]|uniref:FAD binding domain-containing protein n=1 Tax=Parachaetomium inaequale TaxID=2588326 RepID=A0AAN6PFX0_9PEZI|nr:FAD binding domain-containing protein [Parachaetomium inaequale]